MELVSYQGGAKDKKKLRCLLFRPYPPGKRQKRGTARRSPFLRMQVPRAAGPAFSRSAQLPLLCIFVFCGLPSPDVPLLFVVFQHLFDLPIKRLVYFF